ncbi:ATP-dependent nuclease [Cobetia crustatorum]|uniref:ATP-dependent nuclease n=1 Tax=Cobetia crustatorum TaxID=553385 RepID=UPI000469B782|nr:AAA family ATPase [Cobetia crustatorum]
MLFTDNESTAKKNIPSVYLSKTAWDDYTYKTTYLARLYLEEEVIDLGEIKIIDINLDDESSFGCKKENTSTKVPKDCYTLTEEFYSLGQELDYYRKLSGLGNGIGEAILKGLRDCAVYFPPSESIKEHKAFWDSLIREPEAKKCFKEGREYYLKNSKAGKIEFSYSGEIFKSSDSSVDFEFDISSELPSTINVVIGKNGSGKTRLLSKLCEDILKSRRGVKVFHPEPPLVSRVVTISYSAFDDFTLPGEVYGESEKSYKYIGIREFKKEPDGSVSYRIKTSEEHWGDIVKAVESISNTDLAKEVDRFVFTSGFKEVKDLVASDSLQELKEVFSSMSSGQKISLSIICQLAAFLEDDSLVLFDEPENHLHPGLLWNLMVSFDNVLKKKKSFSIVATHSPIILQQVPRKYVNVVRKQDGVIFSDKLSNECFGDSLQSIMEKSFGFVEPEHDYRDVLRNLKVKGYDKVEIESLFSEGLSLQARVFLSTLFKEK